MCGSKKVENIFERGFGVNFFLTAVFILSAPVLGGDLTCASCHPKEAHSQPETSMAHALLLSASNAAIENRGRLSFRDGAYTYTIEHVDGDDVYTVSDGSTTLSIPIRWTFGLNSQTYVLEHEGRLYESRVSYYSGITGLDITMGDRTSHPHDIVEAMGRPISDVEARACFNCHATRALSGDRIQFDSLIPGVQCEHCHASASLHAQAISQGKTESMPKKPGRMEAEEVSTFCGRCHRSFADVMQGSVTGKINVRFQPYRLEKSRCFDGVDNRISCIGCHDPHRELVRDARAYDPNCLACHGMKGARAAKSCPVSKSDCVGCHMPKTELPGSHRTFTDHYIRVVRANESYPN